MTKQWLEHNPEVDTHTQLHTHTFGDMYKIKYQETVKRTDTSTYADIERNPKNVGFLKNQVAKLCSECNTKGVRKHIYMVKSMCSTVSPTLYISDIVLFEFSRNALSWYSDHQGEERDQLVPCSVSSMILQSSALWVCTQAFWHGDNHWQLIIP